MTVCGIIYSATGQSYLDEAIASARSSLRFNAIPHLIFCDAAPKYPVNGVKFTARPSASDPFLQKIVDIGRSPYERTLFLDTDTFVTASILELFDLLSRFDFVGAHAPGYTKAPDPEGSEAFFDLNSGVLAYRRCESVARLIEDWAYHQASWGGSPPFGNMNAPDQHALRRALWRSDVSMYVLGAEYNYRPIFPGRLVGVAKIIHGRSPDYEALAAHLNARSGFRLFQHFPGGRVTNT